MSRHIIRLLGDRLAALLEIIVTVCFFVILIVTILLVTLRYGFNTGIKGADEFANYLFIYMTALGAPAAVFRGDHIAITILPERLPKRAHQAVDVLIQLLIAVVNGVILVLSFSWISGVGSFESPVLRLPSYLIQVSVPIGCAATILFCLVNVLRIVLEEDIITGGDVNVVAPE